MNYLIHLFINFDIYVIVALSLNLLVGYCGLLTLAHAGFYAVGGYAYALLTLRYGLEMTLVNTSDFATFGLSVIRIPKQPLPSTMEFL